MAITKLSRREFDQDTSRARKAARSGPVIITERGRPAHVLLTFRDYQRLTLDTGSVIDILGLPPGVEDVELEIPAMRDLARPADLDTKLVSERRLERVRKADRMAMAEKPSALRTEEYFRERASRADPDKAREILSRAGKGNPPVAGDELPASRAR